MALQESLEVLGAGFKELAKEGPFADFAKGLFGQDLFEAKVSASADDAATGAEGSESYEVAEIELEPLTAPEDWRGNGMFEAGPRGYLEYLRYMLDEYREAVMRTEDHFIFVRDDTGEDWTTHKHFERAYNIIMKDINDELRRFGGPRPEIIAGLYDRVAAVGGDIGWKPSV